MKLFEENENRDLFKGANNQLNFVEGIDAVAQACASIIETQRGELQYDIARGVPTSSTLWTGPPNQTRYQFFCVESIRSIEGVRKVIRFDTEIKDNTLRYESEIDTNFGTVAIRNIFDAV